MTRSQSEKCLCISVSVEQRLFPSDIRIGLRKKSARILENRDIEDFSSKFETYPGKNPYFKNQEKNAAVELNEHLRSIYTHNAEPNTKYGASNNAKLQFIGSKNENQPKFAKRKRKSSIRFEGKFRECVKNSTGSAATKRL